MDDFENLEDEIEEEEGEPSTAGLIAQFFVIPVVIIAACVGVFLLFGLITSDPKNASDYLNDIKISQGNRKWQAAFELSKHLEYESVSRSDPDFIDDLASVFNDSRGDDPRVGRFLVLAMGRLGDKRAFPVLVGSLDDDDSETVIYSLWSLGNLGAGEAVADLIPSLRSNDAGIRKMAAYTLGVLEDRQAIPALQVALNDPKDDVRWNTALALAQLGDASGQLTIRQMLDRDYLNSNAELTDQQKEVIMMNGIRAVSLLRDRTSGSMLVEISKKDPSLKVRQLAMEALSELNSESSS